MASCIVEVGAYPNIGCLLWNDYRPKLSIPKRYLGNRVAPTSNAMFDVTVLLRTPAEQTAFLDWWTDTLDLGINAFTITLSVMGTDTDLTVVLANDLAPIISVDWLGAVRVPMNLKVVESASSTSVLAYERRL